MKHQTDPKLSSWVNHYGCFFMCMVYWFYFQLTGKDREYEEIESIKQKAFDAGIISGDLNHDGDLDDSGEGEIQGDMLLKGIHVNGKDALCDIAGVPLHYIGSVPVEHYKWEPGHFCIGQFHNAWKDSKGKHEFTHYVGVNGRMIAGRKNDREVVEYDPIPDSNTVRIGKLVAVRVFVKKGGA